MSKPYTYTITVNTGLTDDIALEVLDNVIGQMSDGMWENSRVMEHYWPFVKIQKIDGFVCIVVNTEYDYDRLSIVVDHDRYYHNNVWNNWFLRSDKLARDCNKIKKFFAKKIQQIVRENAKDYNWENKRMSLKNDTTLAYMHSYRKDENGDYLPITVADAYKVYAALK